MSRALKRLINFISVNWQNKLLIFFILAMAIPYSFLAFKAGCKFYSPDETANFIFTKSFITNSSLLVEVPLNKEVKNVIFPRSVNVLSGNFVPMSFLGLPLLFGLIGKLLGVGSIIFLTPLFSLVTVYLLFILIKELFNKSIALLSSLLVLFNPIFWYLAGKSMLHNNLFILFLILGLLLLLWANKKQLISLYVVSALCFGASLWVRTSEFFWVCLLLLIFCIVNRKSISWGQFLTFSIGFVAMLGLLLLINFETYGHIFTSGYASLDSAANQPTKSLLMQVVFPLGFNLKNILFHVWEYFVKYLWFLLFPAIWGFISMRTIIESQAKKFYMLATAIISVYLTISYGSYWPWGEYGQPSDPTILIGSPHLRYWLPIFIFLTPFLAYSLIELLPRLLIKSKRLSFIPATIFLVFLIVFSTNSVFFNRQEGFLKIAQDIQDFQPRIEKISKVTPADSIIIIPDWADRIFFPERLVIHSLGDKRIYGGDAYAEVAKLVKLKPVFYYSADSPADIETLQQKLSGYKLQVNYVDEVYKGEKIYQIHESN